MILIPRNGDSISLKHDLVVKIHTATTTMTEGKLTISIFYLFGNHLPLASAT